MDLRRQIESLYDRSEFTDSDRAVFADFVAALRRGEVRAAEKDSDGRWVTNAWVKQGILVGFRLGRLSEMSTECETLRFFDKDTYPLRPLAVGDGVRVVPGGSSIRDGAFVAKGVVMMPPSYINVGAYVDEGTMVDSHALVGSCAQIGKRVHLSAGVQVGGVVEPVNANPVVIEDDVLVGGNSGIYEGVIVRERAVVASGVVLTRSTPVFDLVEEKVYRSGPDAPLEVPAGAVVVQGSRRIKGAFAEEHGLSVYAPVIIKYRDEKTDVSTMLVDYLRS
jgi:2,3,4,5-tetrahydropyridine-2-carboxylate N-succinyltransferase